MAYRNPILAELTTSFTLKEPTLSSQDLLNLATHLGTQGFARIEIGQRPKSPPSATGIVDELIPNIRCWNGDDTGLIQLSPNRLVANHITKDSYSGWEPFRDRCILVALDALKSIRTPLSIQEVEIGTIDKIQADLEHFTIGKYLNCGGRKIPLWYHDRREACDITMGLGFMAVDRFNDRFRVRVRHEDPGAHITIESNFSLAVAKDDDLPDTLDHLHTHSNAHFEEMITDHVRDQVMGGRI